MPEESSQHNQGQTTTHIVRILLTGFHAFTDYPFGIREDQAMQDTVDSVKQNVFVVPAIVWPWAESGYEIIAGHRRKLASKRAGFADIPYIIRNLTDDETIIQLVDSNTEREDVLPGNR